MSDDGMVPRERLNEVLEQLKDAQAQLAEANQELQNTGQTMAGLKAMSDKAAGYKSELDRTTHELTLERSMRAEDVALVKAGIHDDDAIDWLRYKHQRSAADTPFLDYVESMKADPKAAIHRFISEPEAPPVAPPVLEGAPMVEGEEIPPPEPAQVAPEPVPQNGATQPAITPPRPAVAPSPPLSSSMDPVAVAKLDTRTEAGKAAFEAAKKEWGFA